MTDQATRYAQIADGFTARVEGVPEGRWDDPAPCEGWVARDVVRHLVEWIPGFVGQHWELAVADAPSVEDDPVGAWRALDRAVRAAFANPAVADAERDTRMGTMTFRACFDMIATTDVLLHTWDLARATGQDERLDPDEMHGVWLGFQAFDEELLRSSGHYGPRVPVPEDADDQTQVLGYIGRKV